MDDPEVRARYIEAVAENERRAAKHHREKVLLKVQARCVDLIREVITKYPSSPKTRAALEEMIREGITRKELQDEILYDERTAEEKLGSAVW